MSGISRGLLAGLCLVLQACGGGESAAPDGSVSNGTGTVSVITVPISTSTVATGTPTVPDSSSTTGTVSGTDPLPCSQDGQRSWVRSLMDDQYLWYANQGQPNQAATSIDAYFQSLLYRPLDRYSFTQTSEAFVQTFATGRRIGYGYSLVWADAAQTRLRVQFVEPQSPVAAAGLRRGDTVLAIDGFTPAQIFAGAVGPVTQVSLPRLFRIQDGSGQERTFVVNSADFALSPVSTATNLEITRNGRRIRMGYLAYQQFVDYSAPALGQAFASFADQGAQELILDLRYNGGGSVATARNLASMIGGPLVANQVFTRLNFNARNQLSNQTLKFVSDAAQLPAPALGGLSRVFVLVSGSTASASELVVNGLRPFMNVVLIGATTYGKPYGFVPRDWCGVNYNAVNFEAVNALGQGGYVNGIAPTCSVPEDLDHALGDPAEARTRAAIDYAFNGVCPVTAVAGKAAAQAGRAAGAAAVGETWPSQMFLR